MSPHNKLRLIDACAVVTLGLAGAGLAGWYSGSRVLSALRPAYIPMAPNSALVLLLLAASLFGLTHYAHPPVDAEGALRPAVAHRGHRGRRGRWGRRLANLCSGAAGCLAAARLAEYIGGVSLHVDRWIFAFPGLPQAAAGEQLSLAPEGQMGFFTAFGCAGLSVALLLLGGGAYRRRAWRAAEVLALGMAFLGAAFALGYAYDSPLLYRGPTIPMALNTALCLVALGAGTAHLAFERAARDRRQMEAALRESEERFRLLAETAADGVVTCDAHGAIVFVNPAAEQLLGYAGGEMIGMSFTRLLPAHLHHFHAEEMDHYLRTGTQRSSWAGLNLAALHRSGEELAVEISYSGFRRGGEQFFTALIRNLRSRRQVERRLREDRQRFEVLSEISRIAMEDLEYRPMLQRLCDTLARSFNWEFVAVIAAVPERGTFVCEAMASSLPTVIHVGYERELGSGVVGKVAATGVPIVLDDVTTFPGFVDTLPGARAEICVPIEHKGNRLAVLNVESTEPSAFHNQLPFLTKVAEQVAGPLASARLYEETRRRASLALIDGLTGIANRRQFDSVIEREWRRAFRNRTALSLVLLDIDCFKLFNDAYGHPSGDECLRQVAAALAEVAHRAGDLVARYGGEEFALVLPEVDGRGAMRLAEAARRSIEALAIAHATSTVAAVVTASAGVAARHPAHGGEIEDLVADADRGLYLAKRQGRNRVVQAVAASTGAGRAG
jgi:diguanylate cyclase (GGDEF)-like protein/PAS domain S-box-containing protein